MGKHTQVPNKVLVALMQVYLSNYERRVIDCIIRFTYGFHRPSAKLSLTFMSTITGILPPHLSRTKKKLLSKLIITQTGNRLSINTNVLAWKLTQTGSITHLGKLPKQVIKVTQTGNKKLPKQEGKKENINKTYKEIIPTVLRKNTYGNEDINFLIKLFKERFGLPMLDGSDKQNRRYCWLTIKKFGGVDKVKFLINAAAENEFWSTKISSFIDLYYKGVRIINETRGNQNQAVDARGVE